MRIGHSSADGDVGVGVESIDSDGAGAVCVESTVRVPVKTVDMNLHLGSVILYTVRKLIACFCMQCNSIIILYTSIKMISKK